MGEHHVLQTTGAARRRFDHEELIAFCEQRIEKGSKSFAGAAKLFDADTRCSAIMLYAWCRYCDDVIDGQELGFAVSGSGETACASRLAELKARTLDALDGRYDEPVFQALHTVASRHNISSRHPLDLIEGFAMDVGEQSYDTIDQTLTYCYHVAGVVGVMMAIIMGVSEDDPKAPDTLARASDLGIAFQLTNIARDVIPDAKAGRIYLPTDLLYKHGFDTADARDCSAFIAPELRPKVASAVGELLDLADRYYASAGYGIGRLPFRSSWAIASARRVYRDIGRLVRARGEAAWDQRASTSKTKKVAGSSVAFGEALGAQALAFKNGGGRASPADRSGLWTPPFLQA